jgi:hypothetical protein
MAYDFHTYTISSEMPSMTQNFLNTITDTLYALTLLCHSSQHSSLHDIIVSAIAAVAKAAWLTFIEHLTFTEGWAKHFI